MIFKLIPVIEIGYNNQGVPVPEKYPYWHNAEIWNSYHDACYKKAGFTEKLIPYLKGSAFYRLQDISNNNLKKLTIDHTQELRDGKYERQQTSTFFGGYILHINGQDKYFPQCCGGLSDIIYWNKLSLGEKSNYEGHPAPVVTFERDKVILDFTIDEFEEHFQPTPLETILILDKSYLRIAVEEVKDELLVFQKRLELINEKENLNIDNIGGLLIWDNENYK